ncbi:MAG TPA: FAD-binding oxidoreductase [Acidimicrobiales bacterium]|nr:FAD-binding oxidoreductase [Acidimicrobiales bacterium]
MPGLNDALTAIVGPSQVLVDNDVRAPYEVDWTRRFHGPAAVVVRPGSTAEVAAVLAECSAQRTPVVVQGGNTGLVGGGVPAPESAGGPRPVLLSTTRLDSLGPVDEAAAQVTAGAGVTLARLQTAASARGLVFPVDLAARDSATVGGMVATNAGGLHVLRYGPMRTQVVGLEAVLADGTVVSRLSGLIKDNTGYDLSQMLIGSEGTLAVVTAARLRLVPDHPERVVALLGLPGTAEALAAVETVRRRVEGLQAAEIFFAEGLELVRSHSGLAAPLGRPWPAYLLLECAGLTDPSEAFFEALSGLDLPDDATAVAVDPAGQARLWAYRERHTEAISSVGVPHKLDVTLPRGRLAEFEAAVRRVVGAAAPGSRLILFGHVGDGNLHVNVIGPPADDESVDEAVLELVASMDGSISAEHGIGRAKAAWLHLSRSPSELAVMRAVKAAVDPAGLLNPGVLLAG